MKHYKIFNQEKTHNDLKYKTGLNTDILPFNPSGDCEEGGIYFAKEDILAFLDFGPYIAEVEPVGEVYENPGSPKKYKAHQIKIKKFQKIDLKIIKKLVAEGADVHAGNDNAIQCAAYNGHLDVVRYLVSKGADVHAENDYALRWATINGHLDVVRYLKRLK